VTDLRVDWDGDPIRRLAGLWEAWQPQVARYVQRALHPAEVTELCAASRDGLRSLPARRCRSTAGSWPDERR